ncbi:MAG TPA: 3'(2'),5'-bisphosphate nucleotidase CysQ [Sphingorhabdus sp.]|nr:3'(2'),5'-bisphosphate nucleotidase CysQ [Sphingorhabdus sp.]
MTDDELAAHLATDAGRILLDIQRSGQFEGQQLGDEGDHAANAYLCAALRQARPADGLLSEEEKDCLTRCSVSRVWIVDPLDGTREYREGRGDWAVHVALAIDGIPRAGAVALPALGTTLSSANPPPLCAANQPLKMLVSRTRPAPEAIAVAEKLGAELLPMGSAGAKAMAVVRGEADIYLHTGGQYEWDNCAPIAVAQAAGLHCSRIDGTPVRYNNPDPYLPDLLICRPELLPAIMSALAA